MNVISVKNLSKFYNGFQALESVNFDVKQGEIFGFLGPNGAGKTTTIRILTTILLPSSGQITIFNMDITKKSRRVKQVIGVVPEMANVYSDLTAAQNLNLMGELYDVPKRVRKQRMEMLLKQFQLFEKKDMKTKKFSKGMKQRLILCMSLVHEPKILFLDEPTSGLDVQSSRIIKDLIREFKEQGITIFLTTHDMNVANELCDRIAILNKGKIVSLDTPENLKRAIQEVQSLDVVFNREIDENLLRTIPQVIKVKLEKENLRLYVKNPTQALIELAGFVRKNNLELIEYSLRTPSLEDVFIEIIEERI